MLRNLEFADVTAGVIDSVSRLYQTFIVYIQLSLCSALLLTSQLDEDCLILLQRFDADAEEESKFL